MPTCLRRVENWPSLLARTIDANRLQKFSWESHNCCFFAANVVEVLTGVDVAAKFRQKAISAATVRRLVKQNGGVANLASKTLVAAGMTAVPVPLAKRGDVVLAETPLGHAGGICLGANCAFPGVDGLMFLPLSSCSHAFSY